MKYLVIYFSVYHTAEAVAEEIVRLTDADIKKIVPAEPYDGNRAHYSSLLKRAEKEHDEDQRPAISEELPIESHDTIYIGYPIWCYTFPMIIYTLFDQYDFSGKTIIPFNTHMGSRDGGTYQIIRKLAPQAKVLPGLPIEMGEAENGPQPAVKKWLNKLNRMEA